MKSVFVFLMFTVFSFGQVKNPYALIDAKMDKIPSDLRLPLKTPRFV